MYDLLTCGILAENLFPRLGEPSLGCNPGQISHEGDLRDRRAELQALCRFKYNVVNTPFAGISIIHHYLASWRSEQVCGMLGY
jgi:hypothetical protein